MLYFFYVTIWKPSFNIICIRLLFYLQGIQHDLNYLHYFNLLLIDSVHIYTKMFIFTAKLHFKMLEFFFLPVRYLRWESDQHRWGPLCLPAVCYRVSDLSPATESFLILWATRLVTWKLHTGRQVLELNQNITFATCYKFTNRTGVLVLFIILFYYGNSNQKMVLCLVH